MADCPDPAVAFGLAALAQAMAAKAGRLHRGDPGILIRRAARDLPEDAAARDAVQRFAAMAADDPQGAGLVLHDWLTTWRHGLPLRGAVVAGRHAWQDRADIDG